MRRKESIFADAEVSFDSYYSIQTPPGGYRIGVFPSPEPSEEPQINCCIAHDSVNSYKHKNIVRILKVHKYSQWDRECERRSGI